MRSRVVAVVGLVTALAGTAAAGELERLRDENTRLQRRVHDLEAENAALRGETARGHQGLAAALENRATEAVVVSPGAQAGTSRIETEQSRLEGIGGGKGRHWIIWRGEQGAGAARPRTVQLVVDTATSGGAYRDVPTLRLVVDGAPVDCAVTDHRIEMNTLGRATGNRSEGESVTAEVPIETLDRLATAREVSGTLGPTTFRLTPQQLAEVRAFVKRLGS